MMPQLKKKLLMAGAILVCLLVLTAFAFSWVGDHTHEHASFLGGSRNGALARFDNESAKG